MAKPSASLSQLASPEAPLATEEDWMAGGFAVYVHWPFCEAKCPYCDFNSHVRRKVDQTEWQAALLNEISRVAAETPGRQVGSVFFGGGTPSLMPVATVGAVLEAIASAWCLPQDTEVTLEANPTSADAARFAGYRAAGVNRLSLGVQALNERDLARLGRLHDVTQAIAALKLACSTFARVNMDLIYGRPHQTVSAWADELHRAIAMQVDHLSLYQLSIEPGTRFHKLEGAGRLTGLPNPEKAAFMFEMTQEICSSAGMMPYEISNYARTGSECHHNGVYWRYGDYVGIGPGAHGRITLSGKRFATETFHAPERWLSAVQTLGNGESFRDEISADDQATEMLMMGLRMSEGINVNRYAQLSGRKLSTCAVEEVTALDLVVSSNDRLQVTPKGRLLLEAVVARLAKDC